MVIGYCVKASPPYVRPLAISPDSIHQNATVAVATNTAPKIMAPAMGVTASSASRAGVSFTGALAAAKTSMATPNATRPTRRVATSMAISWASELSGRTSSASKRPLRTYWRRRSTLPTARSASAKAQPASVVIRNTSAKPKPPSVGVTRNNTTTLMMSRTPNSTLPVTSTANDVRYCAWLRTCAATRCRYAVSVESATLDHQLALPATLNPAAQGKERHDPSTLDGEQPEPHRGRATLDEDVERNLDERWERRGHDQADRHRIPKEPDGDEQAAEYSRGQHPGGLRPADIE